MILGGLTGYDGEGFSEYKYGAASSNDSDSTGRWPVDEIHQGRAEFELLMRQFDESVSVLEKLKAIAEKTGNDELMRLASEEIAAANAGKERILRLRKMWWNE